jgi:N-acetyl-gamma-glutamyl-phosphate reductase/acetylglutamate kinase
LTKEFRASEISDLYSEKYENERLCLVQKGVVDVRDAENRHGWRVGGIQVHSGGKRVVVTVSLLILCVVCSVDVIETDIQGALDNLLKGAATQCMQVILIYEMIYLISC